MTTTDPATTDPAITDPTERWQKAFATDLTTREAERSMHLRLSQTGQCIRRLYYIAAGEEPTDPPGPTVKNQLAMGHALEVLALMDFKEHGWQTRRTCLDEGGQLTLKVNIDGLQDPILGHPDGACMHEQHTQGLWLPLECKSMADWRASKVETNGIARVEPSYIMQIAMYARPMYDLGMVDHPDRGVMTLISRNGRFLPPERIKWPETLYQKGLDRMADAVRRATDEDPPDRPYDENSVDPPCPFCPFKTVCWADQDDDTLKPIVRGQATPMDHDPELVQAMTDWHGAKQVNDATKAIISQRLTDNDDIPITAAGIKAEYFRPSESAGYDMYELGRHLTGDLMRRHRLPGPKDRVLWVHTE